MKSLETVDELVYGLRDCLTVISTHAQVLLAQQSHRDGTADGLTAIHQAAERAAALLHGDAHARRSAGSVPGGRGCGRLRGHEPQEAPMIATRHPASQPKTKPPTPMAVLAVPDSPARSLLAKVLQGEGLDVILVSDVSVAVEMARVTQPELLMMDVLLPSVSGTAALVRLREVGLAARTIVLTASGSTRAARVAMSLGVGGLLAKPFSLEALVGAICSARVEKSWAAMEAGCGR